MRYIKCEDWNCVVNDGHGHCTNETVNRDPTSCMGRRVPGGEWSRKYQPNYGVTVGTRAREERMQEELDKLRNAGEEDG